MSALIPLRRLLVIRKLQEEQCAIGLEAASEELRGLEKARIATLKRAHNGRRLVIASICSDEILDRLAGLEEIHAASHLSGILLSRIAVAESKISRLREAFMTKRIECRQVETLLEKRAAQHAIETARRSQCALDDWHRGRKQAKGNSKEHVAENGTLSCP